MKELRNLMRHPKYKTEYCRTFHTSKKSIWGFFLHYLNIINYLAGYCPYGPRCHFIHDIHESRITTNTNDTTMRRHSDIRTNSFIQKSATRYVHINSSWRLIFSSL
jgi:hypothetical protein